VAYVSVVFFFFQAEDGIRDLTVTGVQTCALPIYRSGGPFVGPAGRELDKGLQAAGIDRRDLYLTNVVKHFKYRQRGKRRIHQKPDAAEISACRPWLEAELDVVRPDALVALGATAARALLGSKF